MSIREFVNKNPVLTGGATTVLLVLGIFFSARQIHSGSRPPAPFIPNQCFYTTDDGATTFADSVSKIPPFDHDGQLAVRAYVFSADGGRTHWIQYLEKYSNASIKAAGKDRNSGQPANPSRSGLLVKKPGAGAWAPENSRDAQSILTPTPPAGMAGGTIDAVMPDVNQ